MQEKKVFPQAELPVTWTDGDPPLGTEIMLCLCAAPDRGVSIMAVRAPLSSRSLSLVISYAGQRRDSKPRLINISQFGVRGSDNGQTTEEELAAVLGKALHLELHRTPDDDVRGELFYRDGGSERFFIYEGGAILVPIPAMNESLAK